MSNNDDENKKRSRDLRDLISGGRPSDNEHSRDNEQNNERRLRVVKRRRSLLEISPPANSIKDLLEISKMNKFFRNIDSVMLWKITPYLEELDAMIGMEGLKKSVFYQIIYYMQGLHLGNNNEYLHTMILGDPGTGKTTVAKILGKIYQKLGILSPTGPFKIAYRDDFVAEYLGQTAVKTRKLLNSCLGGVLFVDEAYSLGSTGGGSKDSFAKEALDTLTSFLSEHKSDFLCILASYENSIEGIFKTNSGLRRRIAWSHVIDAYTPEQLYFIAMKMIREMKWKTEVKKEDLIEILKHKDNKDILKHGGGSIETLLTKVKMSHSHRVFNCEPEMRFNITIDDIKGGIAMVKDMLKKKNPEEGKHLMMYT